MNRRITIEELSKNLPKHLEEALEDRLHVNGTGAVIMSEEELRSLEEELETLRAGELEPNQTTIEAMKAARRGEFAGSGTVEDLFADLHADD